MGNTSSADANLKRDPSLISKPRALGTAKDVLKQTPSIQLDPSVQSPTDRSRRTSLNTRALLSIQEREATTSRRSAAEHRRSRSVNPPPSRESQALTLTSPPSYSEALATSNATVWPGPGRSRGERLNENAGAVAAISAHRRASSHSHGDRTRRQLQALSSNYLPPGSPANRGTHSNTHLSAGSRHAQVTMMQSGSMTSIGPQRRTVDMQLLQGVGSGENPLEQLRGYNTVFIVDDSTSMRNGLWNEAREALAPLAEMAAIFDDDGIDIHFLNSKEIGKNLTSETAVRALFDTVQPRGITPTGTKLEELLHAYLSRLERATKAQRKGVATTSIKEKCRPVNFIIMTDGAPTDDPEPVIVQAAKRLDAGNFPLTQVGIQFVQIGSDPLASEALRELDDGLAHAYDTRDIVDTTLYSRGGLTPEKLIKILLGGINRRVDKKGGRSVLR